MKTQLILLLLTIALVSSLHAQHQNNNWFFGLNAGITFNTTPPTPIFSDLFTLEGTSCISDPVGNLLFYTDGITVWDRNHDTMPNGTGLLGGFSSTQSALIVPLPHSNSKYFIFTTLDQISFDGGLSYSLVDMELNSGWGDISSETKNTLLLEQIGEKVTCILHDNGHDIWVITHTRNSSDFYAYLVSESGINHTPVISPIGSAHNNGLVGPIKPTHRGDKIVVSNTNQNLVEMFDFDITTGTLSNYVNINDLIPPFLKIYGIEFSPNDSLLYLTDVSSLDSDIFQIELATGSMSIIPVSDFERTSAALQLGPDNKIYLARENIEFIDAINHPDQKGINCEYKEQAIEFPKNIVSLNGFPSHCLYSFFLPNTQILGNDTTLCAGDSIDLIIDISKDCAPITVTWNDGSTDLIKTINQPGMYWVEIESICGNVTDTIEVSFTPCLPIIHYDLEACASYMTNSSNMDYSEFVPTYPTPLSCAEVSATNVFRSNPQENKHSCTPGINGSVAMCISTYPSCSYASGHQSSLVIEVQINPQIDSVVMWTGLSFFEKSPTTYTWIDGPSGPNNYPTKYGIRILKNGSEIFRKEEIMTTADWTLQSFDFLNDTSFRITDTTLFRIELLPYCPVGNGAIVSAWDIDEISFFGGCVSADRSHSTIMGLVHTIQGKGIPDVEMQLANHPSFSQMVTDTTDATGSYAFEEVEMGRGYFLKGYKNDDVANGVSAIDMVHIQKHLLGISPFTSLNQYIAADVDRSGHVSVVDLVIMRKLLLGMISEFPGNTSWRFGYLPQDLSGKDTAAFKEIYTWENLSSDLEMINFVGIKIGDLNGDAKVGN